MRIKLLIPACWIVVSFALTSCRHGSPGPQSSDLGPRYSTREALLRAMADESAPAFAGTVIPIQKPILLRYAPAEFTALTRIRTDTPSLKSDISITAVSKIVRTGGDLVWGTEFWVKEATGHLTFPTDEPAGRSRVVMDDRGSIREKDIEALGIKKGLVDGKPCPAAVSLAPTMKPTERIMVLPLNEVKSGDSLDEVNLFAAAIPPGGKATLIQGGKYLKTVLQGWTEYGGKRVLCAELSGQMTIRPDNLAAEIVILARGYALFDGDTMQTIRSEFTQMTGFYDLRKREGFRAARVHIENTVSGSADRYSRSMPSEMRAAKAIPVFLVLAGSGSSNVWLVNEEGKAETVLAPCTWTMEFYQDELYVLLHDGSILRFGRNGKLVERVYLRYELLSADQCFKVLPGERYAIVNNSNDKAFFFDRRGEGITSVSLLPWRNTVLGKCVPHLQFHLQNVSAVVDGANRLLVCENGRKEIVCINLSNYTCSVFQKCPTIDYWLGAFAQDGDDYYVCNGIAVYSFRKGEAERQLCRVDKTNITSVVKVGDYLYLTSNFGNLVYRYDIRKNKMEEFATSLSRPTKILKIPSGFPIQECLREVASVHSYGRPR